MSAYGVIPEEPVPLRREDYRLEDRITVFQTLVHTVRTGKADIQIFIRAHNDRNLAEVEGRTGIDEFS
jgi:hypothetical protein